MTTEQQYIRSKDVENRASFGQKLLWRIESIAWDVIYWGPFKLMGVDRASNFGGWFFKKIGPLTSTHKTALKNLRMVFPDWSDEQISETALNAWECFGRTAGELPHLPSIDPYEENGRVEIEGLDRLDAIRDSDKGTVMISGHFANWEVMAATICNRVKDAYMTYRALNNPHIDRKLNKVRHDYGTAVLAPKGLGTREVMTALKNHKSVGLMNDQKFNQGIAVPFFGYEAMTAPGPSRLAIKYDVPIVPFSTVRTGPGRFRVTVHEAIIPQKTGDLEADIYATVKRINEFMEDRVRETPGQWFWMHRRWPKEAWKEAGVS